MVEIAVWQLLLNALQANQNGVLIAVAENKGSSPGKPGALMAYSESGAVAGTVGGGLPEANALARAKALLSETDPACILNQSLRDSAERRSGLHCGGEQTLVLCRIETKQIDFIQQMLLAVQNGRRVCWSITNNGLNPAASPAPNGFSELYGQWRYQHRSGPWVEVYIVGGGHVSYALSRVLVNLDFRLSLFEEREQLSSFDENCFVHEKTLCRYEALESLIPAKDNQFVVIITQSFERDVAALNALKQRQFAYLGVLGSKTKISHLKQQLSVDGGATEDFFARPSFHAPMGLPIHSHTADEIAVSVAAEMIAVRNALL